MAKIGAGFLCIMRLLLGYVGGQLFAFHSTSAGTTKVWYFPQHLAQFGLCIEQFFCQVLCIT